jgi:hypothetical protein
MARIDPNATIPPEMLPRIQQVVQAAIARMTGGGVSPAQAGPQAPPQAPPQAGLQVSGPGGGVVQPDAQGIYPSNSMITAGGPPPPVMAQGGPGSSAPIQPTPVPTQAIQRPASPVTDVLTSTEPPVVPSRAAKAIAYYQGVMGNVNSPPEQIQAAKIQLESLQKNTELTPEEKNYAHAVSQGFKGTMQQLAVKEQEDKANATKLGESFASKYDAAVEGAHIAASSKGTVQTALNIVKNDPNFYAGIGEAYNRSIKQIAAAIGLPDTSVGQQIVQKAVADQTVNSIRAFAASSPVGRVLQTEVEAITKSLGNSANTKEALGPLLQLRLNVLNTMEKVGDLAMNHNGGSGRLDPAYDRTVTNYMRTHPVIDANLRAQIEQATGQNKTQAPAAAAPVRVTSPGARDALPRGTQYIAPDGSIRIRQ